jgi:acetyl-CoA carboxylase biotin carboxylase subunit
MECRLYAEDPGNNFFPSPGKIISRHVPAGPGIRLDDGVYEGFTVPIDYDPLLGKLIAWGNDRAEALARLQRAIEEYAITGIKTNVSLLGAILRDSEFVSGEIFTRWLDERLPDFLESSKDLGEGNPRGQDAAILAALLHYLGSVPTGAGPSGTHADTHAVEPESLWKREARREQVDRNP